MKIISKYKDYYDFLLSRYGEDEKLVLDRRNSAKAPILLHNSKIIFYIGGIVIEGYYHKETNRCYYGKDLYQFRKKVSKLRYLPSTHNLLDTKKEHIFIEDKDLSRYIGSYFMVETCYDEKRINEKKNCPIIMQVYPYEEYYMYPKLSDYNLGSFIKPERMWLIIASYLSEQITKRETIEVLSNDLKIQSKGFDLKRSFRPTMK